MIPNECLQFSNQNIGMIIISDDKGRIRDINLFNSTNFNMQLTLTNCNISLLILCIINTATQSLFNVTSTTMFIMYLQYKLLYA